MPFIDTAMHREEVEASTLNPTDFLIWFVENYPESIRIIKQNPEYPYKFK